MENSLYLLTILNAFYRDRIALFFSFRLVQIDSLMVNTVSGNFGLLEECKSLTAETLSALRSRRETIAIFGAVSNVPENRDRHQVHGASEVCEQEVPVPIYSPCS
jgi:hypothetical protein